MLADVALPTFVVFWPPLLFLFIPICLIEVVVLKRFWHVPIRQAAPPVMWANLFSATAGYIATWVGMLFLLEAADWLDPAINWESQTAYVLGSVVAVGARRQDQPELDWLGTAIFLILAYFMSVFFEGAVMRDKLPGLSRAQAWRACWRMNLWSYGFLGAVWVGLLYAGEFG